MEEKAVILVVEDEALIRMGAVQMLEEAGFAVSRRGTLTTRLKSSKNGPMFAPSLQTSICPERGTECDWLA